MSRRRKPKTVTGMLLQMALAPIFGVTKYAKSYKPRPILRKRRRKKR